MNITRENIDELKVVLTIEINESDYLENYNKSIKAYQRKAKISGFRPGKVPMSYIENSHGNAIKYEEINKLISDTVENYLTENKIDYLFKPIMKADGMSDEEWINLKDYVYNFEFITRPKFDFDIENTELDYLNVIPTEERIDYVIKETQDNFGERTHNEFITEDSTVYFEFEELDKDGNIKENGIKDTESFKMDKVKNTDVKNELLGLKVNDSYVFNPIKAFEDESKVESILNLPKNSDANKSDYKITLNDIQTIIPKELNEDFYKKVYPSDDIQTEEQFRERVKKQFPSLFQEHTDAIFYTEAMSKIVYEREFKIPDETLKNALLNHFPKDINNENIDMNYIYYKSSLIYVGFEDYLEKNYGFTVKDTDIKNYARYSILNQFGGFQNIDEKTSLWLDNYVEKMLKEKKQYSRIKDNITEIYTIRILKEKSKINMKDILYDDFVTLLSERQKKHNHYHKHELDHDHEHNHDHDHEHDDNHEHHHDQDHNHDNEHEHQHSH